MSIIVYLKEDVKLPLGLDVSRLNGRCCFKLDQLTDPIPAVAKDFVDEILFCSIVSKVGNENWWRTPGIYMHEDAEAQLDYDGIQSHRREEDGYNLRIRSKRIESALELYRKIRAGIAIPTQRWDEEQKKAREKN